MLTSVQQALYIKDFFPVHAEYFEGLITSLVISLRSHKEGRRLKAREPRLG